jgi:gamma-glutamyltranspeptidase
MSPKMVEHCNGAFYLALGAGGGSRIITAKHPEHVECP